MSAYICLEIVSEAWNQEKLDIQMQKFLAADDENTAH